MPPDKDELIWVKTHWRVDQLDEKKVEFRLPLKGQGILEGIGELSAKARPQVDDLLSIQILKDQATGNGPDKRQTVIPLSEKLVSLLEPHLNRQLAQFRLVLG